jgi:hypothetical protein
VLQLLLLVAVGGGEADQLPPMRNSPRRGHIPDACSTRSQHRQRASEGAVWAAGCGDGLAPATTVARISANPAYPHIQPATHES